MMTQNAAGAALTVAEKNGRILEALLCARAVITVALDALGACADANAAHRLLVKACGDVHEKVSEHLKKDGAK